MFSLSRSPSNPLIKPDPLTPWRSKAAFNGSVLKAGDTYHMVYRAMSDKDLSTIGHATSFDGIDFENHEQIIIPSESWDKYGCEDPRITKIEDDYLITYTGLSDWPPSPGAIKIGVAVGKDLHHLTKHLVTPFNSKAMAIFPEKINGKYVALLTVNTDLPPALICLAEFDKLEDLWSVNYWHNWYAHLESHVIPLTRLSSDQLEVGAVPIKTKTGWLVVYAHIQHYYSNSKRKFGIETLLLDLQDPSKVIARTGGPIITPAAPYEMSGQVNNVIFPSGALIENDMFKMYYGAGDSSCCLATCKTSEIMAAMSDKGVIVPKAKRLLERPLMMPWTDHDWEAKAVFNPAVFDDGKSIHILYRAMSPSNRSVFGYARSENGIDILERGEMPSYEPRARFEVAQKYNVNYGSEDPRLTRIGDRLYMCYTAFNGQDPPRVAFASISVENFVAKNFSNWTDPVLISPPGIDDKDAVLFPEKIGGKYVFLHRIQGSIVFDSVDSLEYFDGKDKWLRSLAFIPPREEDWDNEKIGACSPPIKTDIGWLLFYHGVSKKSFVYRVGALILDLNDPCKVLYHTPWPVLEPITNYEKQGIVPNVVFPCGIIKRDETIYMYYGAADQCIGVATLPFETLINYLLDSKV